jgi:acyl dehydratase
VSAATLVPGTEFGASPWVTISQDDLDAFAQVTRDHDPMHVDPTWAAQSGPFPTTVAFGFLTLSLITHFSHQVDGWPSGGYALNYGFDRVRFVSPVPVGARVRGRFRLLSASPRDGATLTRTAVTVEIEGHDKPAVVAEWLGLFYDGSAQSRPA